MKVAGADAPADAFLPARPSFRVPHALWWRHSITTGRW